MESKENLVKMSAKIKQEEGVVCPQFHTETIVKEELILDDEEQASHENVVISASGYEITIKNEPPEEEEPSDTIVTEEPAFSCDKCNKQFTSKRSYSEHLLKHRNLESKRFMCAPCQKPFGTAGALETHERRMHGGVKSERPSEEAESAPKRFRCDKCDKQFDVAISFKMHRKRHRDLDSKRFVCAPCRKIFATRRELNRHQQNVHGGEMGKLALQYKCRYRSCETVCDNKESFEEHLEEHRTGQTPDGKRHRCGKCEKFFASGSSLKRHLELNTCDYRPIVLEEEDGTFKCSTCSKTFSQQHLIDQHIRTHLGRPEFRFATLDFTEKQTEELGTDPIAVEQNGEEFFKCPMCLKLIQQHDTCVRHIGVHITRARTTFQCEACGLYVADNKELAQHAAAKHGRVKSEPTELGECDEQGLFRCTECTKTFTQRRLVMRHFRRHEAMKKGSFQCKICEKFFPENAELMKHSIEKHGEEPKAPKTNKLEKDASGRFKCTQCEQTFELRQPCAAHIRRHQIKDSARYQCKKCLKCFVKQVDLLRHERAATKLTESFCNKNLKSSQLNKSELLKQTDKPYQVIEENDLFICSSCGKVFLQRQFCVSHIRKHIDLEQGRFRCETCETNFATNTELRRHAALKHGTSAGVERPRLVPIKLEQDEDGWFKCPECPERFQQRVTCTKHVKRHENLRSGKYRCDFEPCEMRFGSNFELKRHVLVHTNGQPANEASTSKAPTNIKEEIPEEIVPDAN
uniref:Zinc finger protein Xfin n=1 Tax=Culex pipiens TaxID=7175 RepID=A0A8D8FXK4_CULPI